MARAPRAPVPPRRRPCRPRRRPCRALVPCQSAPRAAGSLAMWCAPHPARPAAYVRCTPLVSTDLASLTAPAAALSRAQWASASGTKTVRGPTGFQRRTDCPSWCEAQVVESCELRNALKSGWERDSLVKIRWPRRRHMAPLRAHSVARGLRPSSGEGPRQMHLFRASLRRAKPRRLTLQDGLRLPRVTVGHHRRVRRRLRPTPLRHSGVRCKCRRLLPLKRKMRSQPAHGQRMPRAARGQVQCVGG